MYNATIEDCPIGTIIIKKTIDAYLRENVEIIKIISKSWKGEKT